MYKKARTSYLEFFLNGPEIILLKTVTYEERSLVESVVLSLEFGGSDQLKT